MSAPTTDAMYPEAMRTRAWAMKTLNAQLASWTELRHDTLLYVQQSYTQGVSCGYPTGFVEPCLEFWQRMQALATIAGNVIAALPLSGSVTVPSRDPIPTWINYDLGTIKARQIACFNNFAAQMGILKTIAGKELAQQPLIQSETDFLRNVMQIVDPYTHGLRLFDGWYPGLFYQNAFSVLAPSRGEGCDMWDAMVADVHTDPPDPLLRDPGAVLHEGVGSVHMLVIAMNNRPDRMVYAGPVLSHYEFEKSGTTRLSDADWKANLRAGQKPPSPDWTTSCLVPSPFTVTGGY